MAQPRPTLCAADASSPCASAKRQETTECAICGKVVRRGGLARHHLSDACRQAHAKRCCCGPASGKEADIFAREVFGCNNGAVIIDGVDYAPKLSRAAHFNGYTPIPLPDRDHSGPAALLKADSTSEEDGSGLAADGKDNVYIVEEEPCICENCMSQETYDLYIKGKASEQDKGNGTDTGDNKSKAGRELEAPQEIERQRIEWERHRERQQALWEAGVDSLPPLPARPSIYQKAAEEKQSKQQAKKERRRQASKGKGKGQGKKGKGKARAWSEVKCRDCNQWHLWPECCGVLMAAQVIQWSCACCQQTITEQDRGKDKGDNKSKAQRELEAFQAIERQLIEEEDKTRQAVVEEQFLASWDAARACLYDEKKQQEEEEKIERQKLEKKGRASKATRKRKEGDVVQRCDVATQYEPCAPRCWGLCVRCGQRCDLPYGHQDHCLDGFPTPPSLACPRTGLTPASAAVVSGCASEMGGIPPAHVDPDVKITQFVSRRRKERRRQEESKGKADGEVGTEGEGNRKRRKGKGKSCTEGNGKSCNEGPPSNWVPKGPCPHELFRRFEEGKVNSSCK